MAETNKKSKSSNLTQEEKDKKNKEPLFDLTAVNIEKIKKFYQYVNYEFDTNSDYNKQAKLADTKSMTADQLDYFKKKFYMNNVDKEFDLTLNCETEAEKELYVFVCQFLASMGSLSMKTYTPSSKENKYCLVKRIFYLLYIL